MNSSTGEISGYNGTYRRMRKYIPLSKAFIITCVVAIGITSLDKKQRVWCTQIFPIYFVLPALIVVYQ